MNDIKLYVLENEKIRVVLSNAGASIVSIEVPDRFGGRRDVVLGFEDLRKYKKNSVYFGAVLGRFAGEISQPFFLWEGERYELSRDENGVHLHGGETGISFKLWDAVEEEGSVLFTVTSADKEGGYPGNVTFFAKYILEENALVLEYGADSDRNTPVNMTAHPYFNLNGHDRGSISEHELFIDADRYTVTADEDLRSGKQYECETVFDFRKLRKFPQTFYDCNYILNKKKAWDARLYGCESGISLKIACTQPCLQLYTSCETDEIGKNGIPYKPYGAVCMEPQHTPNIINLDVDNAPFADRNGRYRHKIRYEFEVVKMTGEENYEDY